MPCGDASSLCHVDRTVVVSFGLTFKVLIFSPGTLVDYIFNVIHRATAYKLSKDCLTEYKVHFLYECALFWRCFAAY